MHFPKYFHCCGLVTDAEWLWAVVHHRVFMLDCDIRGDCLCWKSEIPITAGESSDCWGTSTRRRNTTLATTWKTQHRWSHRALCPVVAFDLCLRLINQKKSKKVKRAQERCDSRLSRMSQQYWLQTFAKCILENFCIPIAKIAWCYSQHSGNVSEWLVLAINNRIAEEQSPFTTRETANDGAVVKSCTL
jgi:hypothetical protein